MTLPVISADSSKERMAKSYTGPHMLRVFVVAAVHTARTPSQVECIAGKPGRSYYPHLRRGCNTKIIRHGLFWRPFAAPWSEAFGQKALNKARAFEGHIQRRVKRYTQSVCESRQLPDEFKTSFRSYAYKIENFTGEYRSKIRASFSQYRVAVGQIRLSSRDQLTEHMKDGYLAAQKITGRRTNA